MYLGTSIQSISDDSRFEIRQYILYSQHIVVFVYVPTVDATQCYSQCTTPSYIIPHTGRPTYTSIYTQTDYSTIKLYNNQSMLPRLS